MTTHKQRRLRAALVLLVILVCLLGSIVVIRYRELTTAPKLTINSVHSITIWRPDHPDIALKRTPAGWEITAPFAVLANSQRVEPLLALLAMGDTRYAAAEVDLDAAGLLEPLAIVHFNDLRIALGNTDISNERRYARRNDEVVLVGEWVLPLINGGLSALADLHLFHSDLSSLTATPLEDSASPITLDPGNWQSLSAQQILKWPLENTPIVNTQFSLSARQNNGGAATLDVLVTDRFAALHYANTNHAYIVSIDDLPKDLLSR